jgi:L-glyceraldehyde 3-phosphate reductase
MLTNKYLNGIPSDSRAAKPTGFLKAESVTDARVEQIRQLNTIAATRGQTLAQMALSWVLRHKGVTSVLIGASRPEQITDCVGCLKNLDFSADELARIDAIAPA